MQFFVKPLESKLEKLHIAYNLFDLKSSVGGSQRKSLLFRYFCGCSSKSWRIEIATLTHDRGVIRPHALASLIPI